MTRSAACFLLTAALTVSLRAQTPQFTDPANLRGERVHPRDGRELPIDTGSLGLQQLLRKLATRASILNIVAHPDDEDGGMLTLYARGLGARVADISLTRGEGGQNAMTGDFEDALGLLRTQELLANDRYTGVDQMFGTEVDFGFSKTKSESFAKWTHDRVLYDVVRAIRLYRPLVLTSTWTGGVTDGHGQHQVSGQIAQEAFLAAGDPKVFPELTAEGILPWQPLRMYARVPQQAITDKGLFDYATGQYVPAKFTNYITGVTSSTPPSTDILVHEGDTDPLLLDDHNQPLSYLQFARLGLSQQKSQIGPTERRARPGVYDVPYHLYGSCVPEDAPAATRPEGSHPELSEGSASRPVTAKHLSSRPERSEVERSAFPPAPTRLPAPSSKDHELTFFTNVPTSFASIATLAPSAPAWLPKELDILGQEITEAAKWNADPATEPGVSDLLVDILQRVDYLLPEIEKSPTAIIEKADLLHELRIKRVQLNDALVLAAGLQLRAATATADLPARQPATATATLSETSTLPLTYIRGWSTAANGKGIGDGHSAPGGPTRAISVDHPLSRSCDLPADDARLTEPYFFRDNIEQPIYQLRDPSLRDAPSTPPAFACSAELSYKGVRLILATVAENDRQPAQFVPASSAGLRRVGYPGLPITNYFPPTVTRIPPANLKLPPPDRRRIAYLPGTGDAVPEALASIGLPVTTLTVSDLTAGNLARFDTIILGVRTYVAHPDLHGVPTQSLLDFARAGGNVVVQYQTPEFTEADAPYPLSLGSNEKVVDETAPVRILAPDSHLLTTPNRINPADFDNWISERGHGFLATWDDRYTALTETHDPGAPAEDVLPQDPQRGGLITTRLGPQSGKQGRWTYCAFALYRQLPEANPGAFRLFLNLLTP